jgi:hypothetical protein
MENLLTIMFTALQHTTYLVGFVAIKRSLLCVSFDWIAAYSWPQKDQNVETLIFNHFLPSSYALFIPHGMSVNCGTALLTFSFTKNNIRV